MERILFASDLDNTLLFSYRHREEGDQCVEYLDGREQGFCTQKSLNLLARICEKALFIPVTTRSVAQYRRILWPAPCTPRYAAATNGGILLADGEPDPEWCEQSRQLAAPWLPELLELEGRLPEAPALKRYRVVDGLYLFAACDDPESAQAGARYFTGKTGLQISVSGRKVYFFPPPINKGTAVSRLKERFSPVRTICAGDSVIDAPMARAADLALFPNRDLLRGQEGAALRTPQGPGPFPDFVTAAALEEISRSAAPRRLQPL